MPAVSTTSTGTAPSILIVEDDASVRQLLCRMLGHLGARPTTALDTADAVAAVHAEPGLALALIDLSLNGADGVTTARALRLLLPDLLIVLMSGDIAHLLAAQQLVGTPHILQKPFSLRDMAELVAIARCNPPRLKERYV
jgi:two-component system OmpR family response regulator